MGQTEPCFCYLAKNKAMSLPTKEIDSPEDEAILLSLLPKFNGKVIDKKATPKAQSFVDIAREIAANSNIHESFGDASEWQREVRSWDHVLVGREV